MGDHAKNSNADAHSGADHADQGHKAHKKHHPHRHEEHEHEEGWIVSFADNVLLMMGFFVILLAMNMGPKGTSDVSASSETANDRLLDVAIAVREAFHNPVSLSSLEPEDQPLIRRVKQKMGEGPRTSEGVKGQDRETTSVRPSDWVSHDAFVEFEQNQSELSEEGKLAIAQIAAQSAGSRWMIEVRGHASRMESWGDFKKSRDLSYARAFAVGEELVRCGLTWPRIRLTSSGDSAPVVPRARTADQHQTNQRTEVLILPETMPADPFNASGTGQRD